VDSETGNLSSIFDKVNQREVLSAPETNSRHFRIVGNTGMPGILILAMHNIPFLLQRLLMLGAALTHLRPVFILRGLLHNLGLAKLIRCPETLPSSRLIPMPNGRASCIIKAAFPLNLEAEAVTYEIPCGTIERSTRPQTDQDRQSGKSLR
jgi:alpha-mannosidase